MSASRSSDSKEKKAVSARLLNRLGINTNDTVDYVLEWVDVLAVAVVLAVLIMSFVTVRMTVPTRSMEPTIKAGDSFFVDKISYYFREPKRGDIIVFWHKENGKKKRYVKRLIGKSGDTVLIKNEDVYINGKEMVSEEFDRDYSARGRYGRSQVKVPDGKYYVLGDNTENSLDSRYWGFADKSSFIGEPYLRVWPLKRFGLMN